MPLCIALLVLSVERCKWLQGLQACQSVPVCHYYHTNELNFLLSSCAYLAPVQRISSFIFPPVHTVITSCGRGVTATFVDHLNKLLGVFGANRSSRVERGLRDSSEGLLAGADGPHLLSVRAELFGN